MKYIHSIIAIIFCTIVLVSCPEGPAGIFSSVSNEKEIMKNKTKGLEDSSPSFVAQLGNNYFAGIGRLWIKSNTGTTWNLASTSGLPESGAYAASGVNTSAEIYVLFQNASTGNYYGVYKSTDGSNWTGIPNPDDLGNKKMRKILAANDIVFLVCEEPVISGSSISDSKYSVYYLDGTAWKTTGIKDNTDIGMPNSLAHDGTNFWVTAGGIILKGGKDSLAKVAGPDDWTTSSTASSPQPPRYGGICAIDTKVLITGRFGKIFYGDGSSWTSSGPHTNNDSKPLTYSLSLPAYDSTNKILFVGTSEKPLSVNIKKVPSDGYLEFDLTNGFTANHKPLLRHEKTSDAYNFASSLSGKSVTAMYVFAGSQTKVFALSSGSGLWSNTKGSGSWSGWYKE